MTDKLPSSVNPRHKNIPARTFLFSLVSIGFACSSICVQAKTTASHPIATESDAVTARKKKFLQEAHLQLPPYPGMPTGNDPVSKLCASSLKKQFTRDPEGAIADLTKAIAIKPDLPYCYFARANLYLRIGEEKQALHDSDSGLRLDPKSSRGWYDRTQILLEFRRYNEVLETADKAERAFDSKSRFYPIFTSRCYLSRAKAYEATGRTNDALAASDKAISFDPSFTQARALRLDILKRLRKWPEVVNMTTFLIEHHMKAPKQYSYILDRADAYAQLGNYHMAMLDYQRGLQNWPDVRQFHTGVLMIYKEIHDAKAVREEEAAIEKLDKDSRLEF